MLLFIGLGNPGKKYAMNRHNVGFIIVDAISKYYNFPKFVKKNKSFFSIKKSSAELNLMLLKPNTFMNFSGISVLDIKSYYNINNDNIFVFHDEIDLNAGEIKIKKGGGNNGHNGLKSIDNHIGKDYHRIKIGVGRPEINDVRRKKFLISNWVLSDFSKAEKKEWLEKHNEMIPKNFEYLKNKDFKCFLENLSNYKGI